MDILGILEEVWEKTDSPDDKSYNDLMDIILAVRQTARKEKCTKLPMKSVTGWMPQVS